MYRIGSVGWASLGVIVPEVDRKLFQSRVPASPAAWASSKVRSILLSLSGGTRDRLILETAPVGNPSTLDVDVATAAGAPATPANSNGYARVA